jgi:hypothetical protein
MRLKWALILCFAVMSLSASSAVIYGEDAKPILDNERVTVWDVTWTKGTSIPAPALAGDWVRVDLLGGSIRTTAAQGASHLEKLKAGDVRFEPRGATRNEEGVADNHPSRSIVVALKDHPVDPIANNSGYPDAFPRPRVKKRLENDRIVVWEYTWLPGQPTPMHFHSRDVIVVQLTDGALRSTTPDGKSVVLNHTFGLAKFSPRNRTHFEELAKGHAHAIMVELK